MLVSRDRINARIPENVRRLTYCCHSLGSCVGYYLSIMRSLYDVRRQTEINLLTFGEPKCIAAHTDDTFNHCRMWYMTPRGILGGDFVPYLPPDVLIRPDLSLGKIPASVALRLAARASNGTIHRLVGLCAEHQCKAWYIRGDGSIDTTDPGVLTLSWLNHTAYGLTEYVRTGAVYHYMHTAYLPASKRCYENAGGTELAVFNGQ